MQDINKKIEEQLKAYKESVQDVARKAIEHGQQLSPARLAQLLESHVKTLARQEVNK